MLDRFAHHRLVMILLYFSLNNLMWWISAVEFTRELWRRLDLLASGGNFNSTENTSRSRYVASYGEQWSRSGRRKIKRGYQSRETTAIDTTVRRRSHVVSRMGRSTRRRNGTRNGLWRLWWKDVKQLGKNGAIAGISRRKASLEMKRRHDDMMKSGKREWLFLLHFPKRTSIQRRI